LRSHVALAVMVDDVALLYTDYTATMINASKIMVEISYQAIEVLRRQPEGMWKKDFGGSSKFRRPAICCPYRLPGFRMHRTVAHD
jgi:hypothetical protein